MAGDKINDVKPIIIEKFDGKGNFTLWQRKMKNVLIQQDLQHAILGVEKKPEETTDAQWKRMDVKAKSSIELHLADNVMLNVDEDMNAKEAWDKLEKVYRGKTLSNKLFLKDELLNLRMEEGVNLQDHLSRFQNCVANLLKVDVKYDDDDKALLLLRSLPPSFKHFRTTIMFGKESLKLDEVMEAIQSYVKMDENTEGSQAHGLYAKGKERGRSQSRHDKSGNRGRSKSKGKEKENKGCFTCGATDHWKKNCKIWQERKAKAMARNSSSASVVTSDESDGELLAVTSSSNAFQHWILDTGCSFHMCANKEWFDTYEESSCGEVLMGDDSPCKIQGIGSVKIRMHDGIVRVLDKVRHVPKLKKNLISLGTLDKAGYKYCSEGGILKVIKGLLVMMRGDIQPNTLYKLRGTTIVGGAAISVEKDETELWHCRLGHMSQRGMQELHKKNQLKGVSFCKLKFCKYCTLGKQTKTSFKIADSEKRSKEPLYYIHTDVWGPAPTRSKGGSRYFVTFLDDFSRKVWVYFMREKSEVFTKFKEWKAEVENQTGRKIRYLRSDNGGEYRDNKFLQFCREEGITRHFTVKKTPQQNGAAERMNRTLMERERSMRFHAGLPDIFWAEAVNHACYLVNRSPSRVLDYKCAEEVWSRKPVEYSNLRVFGCSAYAHIPSDERTKLKPKSLECIFIGFEKGVKGYKLWDFVNKKKVLSRDVVFDEKTMPLNKIMTSEEKKRGVIIDENKQGENSEKASQKG